jgi:hypothetical protein
MMTPDEEDLSRSHVPGEFSNQNLGAPGTGILRMAPAIPSVEEPELHEHHITLNPSQRQRLLVTCKHIDKLLGNIEDTLNAAASKSVFPGYVGDIIPQQRKTIEDYIARLREQLLQVLARQSLAPEEPRISAVHAIHVDLTFIEIAIAELDPHYMRGYGLVSEQGASDLHGVIAELQTTVKELHGYVLQSNPGNRQDSSDAEAEGTRRLRNKK